MGSPEEEDRDEERTRQYRQFKHTLNQIKKDAPGIEADSEKHKKAANHFFSLGCYEQAAMMYTEALELDGENAILRANRAMAYLKQNMYDEALLDADLAIEFDPKYMKGYWRKCQALLKLDRPEDAEICAGHAHTIQPTNKEIEYILAEAKKINVLNRLLGTWTGKLANGVEQKWKFDKDKTMTMFVFGQALKTKCDISITGRPRSLRISMQIEKGTGPPPPAMPYIFELKGEKNAPDEELWLCQPMTSPDGKQELAEKFEGEGFCKMRRVAETPKPDSSKPLDEQCEEYLQQFVKLLPELPQQLPEKPSEEEIADQIKQTQDVASLRETYGIAVHRRCIDLAKAPHTAGSKHLQELATETQKRLLSRKLVDPQDIIPDPAVTVPEPESNGLASAVKEAKEAAKEVAPPNAATAEMPSAMQPPAKTSSSTESCLGQIVARLCGRQ